VLPDPAVGLSRAGAVRKPVTCYDRSGHDAEWQSGHGIAGSRNRVGLVGLAGLVRSLDRRVTTCPNL